MHLAAKQLETQVCCVRAQARVEYDKRVGQGREVVVIYMITIQPLTCSNLENLVLTKLYKGRKAHSPFDMPSWNLKGWVGWLILT